MKLEVEQFVRYRRGSMGYNIKPVDKIGKIINQVNDSDIYELDNNNNIFENDVVKASFNIIDLIEEGDYVNGLPVARISEDTATGKKYFNLYGYISGFEEKDIEFVVTKEQIKQISYKVGEKI